MFNFGKYNNVQVFDLQFFELHACKILYRMDSTILRYISHQSNQTVLEKKKAKTAREWLNQQIISNDYH